jgi:hypothetical protein
MVVLNLSIGVCPLPTTAFRALYSHNSAVVFSNYVCMYVSKVICAALVRPELRVKQMCLLFLS